MKYVLINKSYEVIDEVDSVTPGGAEHYFMGRKQIKDKDKFYSLWQIKTKKEHNLNVEAFARKASSEHIEWWKEEATNPDEGFDY